jgi:SAM-dependent methyltransferase
MLNWRIRYCKILDQNRDLFDVSKSILEVGSGNIGVARYLKRKVVGLERDFIGPVDEWLEPARGDILDIPFADRSFDIVLCVDVLEHLSESSRPRAISELIRCARSKVFITCPCGSSAEEGERHLAELFRKSGVGMQGWLAEHIQNGLPSVGSIFKELAKTGLEFEITGNESMNQHFAGVLLDYFFPFSWRRNDHQASRTPFVPPIGEAEWDSYYSFLFTTHIGTEDRSRGHLDSAHVGTGDRPRGHLDCAESNARIYAVYPELGPTEHLGRVTPIFAGAAAMSAPPGALTDILLGEPRLPNGRWSELSAYYKIWKEGPRSDIVGFCHYRRLFNFGAAGSTERETVLSANDLKTHTGSYFDEHVLERVYGNAIICAQPMPLSQTIWEHYDSWHNIKDYCRILSSISRRYPELFPFSVEHFESKQLYYNNVLVINWYFFNELCTLWFDLLQEFEREVPAYRGTAFQNMDVSFLAVRIFDLWVRHKKSMGTTIIETPIFVIR